MAGTVSSIQENTDGMLVPLGFFSSFVLNLLHTSGQVISALLCLFVQKFKAYLHECGSCGCKSVHLLFCLGLTLYVMLVLLLWQQREVKFIVKNSLETSFERCSG